MSEWHAAGMFLIGLAIVVAPRRGAKDEQPRAGTAAGRRRKPMTFRSGGTSLCGQGVTDSTLVDTRSNSGLTLGPQTPVEQHIAGSKKVIFFMIIQLLYDSIFLENRVKQRTVQ